MWQSKNFFYLNFHVKDALGMELPEGALTLFTVYDAYRYFARQALLMTSPSKFCTEYLLPTYIIIVLD